MKRPVLLGLTILVALSGCGMGSHFGVDPSEFRYQPSETVSDKLGPSMEESSCLTKLGGGWKNLA